MTETDALLFEKGDDNVATITINRPQALNAFTIDLARAFRDLWQQIAEDDDIHAVVLRAAPGRAFSTGMDVWDENDILGSPNLWNKRDPGDLLGPKHNRCWKPVIIAVHGLCAGGAFYWLNEADIVICSEEAQFFDPHVTYGMTAALEPIGLRWRIPLGDVLRMALLGNDERICAATALQIRLVSEVVPLDQLWTRAHDLAAKIAAKPSVATQGTVRAVWESMDLPRTAGLAGGLKYCMIGNESGQAEVSRSTVMGERKRYEIR